MKVRDNTIDLIKAFSILCVVFVHVNAGMYSEFSISYKWLCGHVFGVVSRIGVPLFLMCSGCLFLDSEKNIDVKLMFSKYIPRIVVSLFFWAIIYKLYHLDSTYGLKKAIRELLLFEHEFHLYYLHIIILAYACVPIMRVFIHNASQKMIEYTLLIWFVLGIIFPTFIPFEPLKHITGIPLQWKMNMSYSSLGYFLLGYYLKKYPMQKFLLFTFIAIGFLFAYFGTVAVSLLQGGIYMGFLEGMSFGICFFASGIFGFILKTNARTKLLEYISKASFCIYLSHMLVLYVLRSLLELTLFAQYTLTFTVCLALYFVLSKTPVLKNWVI